MNNITFTGHITWIGPLVEGIGKASGKPYRVREFVMDEVDTQIPQSIKMKTMNDEVLAVLEQLSQTDFPKEPRFTASLNFKYETREKQDKSGTFSKQDISCWRLKAEEGGAQ